MTYRPRIDKINFKKEMGKYFRDCPDEPFMVFDKNRIFFEPPEKYREYSQVPEIDTLIVKVGTSFFTHDDYERRIYNMNCLSEDLTRLKEERKLNVMLISSGAIGLGRKARLRRGEKIPEKEKDSPEQKRLDAIEGQTLLFELWRTHFYPQLVEECLVTHNDIKEPKNTTLLKKYQKWFSEGKIPVINEDDARSLEEIDILFKGERVFRDNDGLASLHAVFLKNSGYKPILILLSNTDGIYVAQSLNREYQPVRIVKDSYGLEEHALPISSQRGRGGILSKIEAARDAAMEDIYVVTANGHFCNHDRPFQSKRQGSERKYKVLDAVLDGDVVGTRFLPKNYIKQ